ncbi:MAG: MFS transporter [Anaerolineae bacterium]
MRRGPRYRWFVVAVLFMFMLLHQSDRLLIGPLTSRIMDSFGITMTQMGAVSTGALIVGAILYPLWGYWYDRYARAKLLALASFIWGCTTWLSAIAPTYPLFLATRASTGIDDSSYPGIYSLISDYFGPKVRGRIYGLLQLTQPLGYMVGMLLALLLGGVIGWRGVFYITGSLGVVLAIAMFFGVKDAPRGNCEPEMAGVQSVHTYHFDWAVAKQLFRKPSLILLFIQGFFGVFPWNAITFWFFTYLERERGYTESGVLVTMVIAVLVLAAGYPLGGLLGDKLFQRTPRGRLIVATVGVIMGAVLLGVTLNVPLQQQTAFLISLSVTALFIPFAAANVTSTVFDVTLPEVRSTASAIQSFIESIGAALSPMLVGFIADRLSLRDAFLIICLTTWAMCAVFFVFAARSVPGDIAVLRRQMRERAETERAVLARGEAPGTPVPGTVG